MGQRADQLIAEHDHIAEILTTLVKAVNEVDSDGLHAFRTTLARFEELYASHSKGELGFLTEVEEALAGDRSATEQLRALLDEP
jgi:hypothetical protein